MTDIQNATLHDFDFDFTNRALIRRMKGDLRNLATTKMNEREVQYLVKLYYTMQKYRIVTGNRIKSIARIADERDEEPVPCDTLNIFGKMFEDMENLVLVSLKAYVENHPLGQWLISQKGIGPVLSAGFISYFDIKKGIKPGSFVAFAGMDPTMSWDAKMPYKGKIGCWKRTITQHVGNGEPRKIIGEVPLGRLKPFSTEAKTLVYKAAKSFVMVGAGEDYNRLYAEKKTYLTAKNESGGFKERAASLLARYNKTGILKAEEIEFDDPDEDESQEDIATYKKTLESGKLIKAHIDAMARRWVGCLFLSHYWTVCYEHHHKKKAPNCYAVDHLNHMEQIPVPKYKSPY